MKMFFVLLVLALAAPSLYAIDEFEALPDPALQARYEKLTRELRCLQCQNQSIADSPVWLATDLRTQVRDMLLDGKSDQEIYDYMTARYGDFILYRPPLNKKTWLLWFSPALLMLTGMLVLIRIVIKRSRLPVDLDEQESQ